MTQKDLQIGDIVVLRNGDLGFYFEKDGCGYFVYQESGYDDVDNFADDLTNEWDDSELDVMQVYRPGEYCSDIISFYDYDEGELIFERDETWENPDLKAKAIEREKAHQEWLKKQAAMPPVDRGITILSQAFYGNRTSTEVKREKIDMFILGCLDSEHFDPEREDIDRTMIPIPGSDELVIIYNKYQEEECLEDLKEYAASTDAESYSPRPLADIPEIGLKLYSRCIVCRRDENGDLQSLEREDYPKFMKYMAE